MIRLCLKSRSVLNQLVHQSNHQKVTSQLKDLVAFNNILSRNYAVQLREEETNLEKVYYGPLTPQIKSVKVFSLSSSVAGLLAQPIIIKEAASIGSTSLIVALCSVVGFFTFVTPVLLHLVTKKYVTEILYDPNTSTYKATTINFFLVRKQLEFKVEDVHVPDMPGMFTTMKAKGVPLFIEARFFSDPMHYAKIMGYDKPLDFKLGDDTSSESSGQKQ